MKKEIVVATAITALLSSLSADTKELNLNKLSADSTGKILTPKKVKGKIDINKRIGKKDNDKFNLICGKGCISKPKPNINKTPKLNQKPDISKRP